jgi:ADP-glucose pyrophosphorylase
MEAHMLLTGGRLLPDATAVFDQSVSNGSVVIGPRSKVIKSELTDVMVFSDCVIENCTIRNCVIDDGCILKGVDLQNQMLRAGTRLEVK